MLTAHELHTNPRTTTMASIYKMASGWRVQVRIKGQPAISATFDSKREADDWAREKETELRKSPSQKAPVTYADLTTVYLSKVKKPKGAKERIIRKLKEEFGAYRLPEIKHSTIVNYAIKRRRVAGPATTLMDLVYLGIVLRHGGAFAECDDARLALQSLDGALVSLRHGDYIAPSLERSRRPTEDELIALEDYFATLPKTRIPMFDMILFAISTCLRLGEIVGRGGVLLDDVDFSRRTALIRARKDPHNANGHDDVIPLLRGPFVYRGQTICPVEIIKRQRSNGGRIFPWAEKSITQAMAKATTALGIEDLRFHDFRHDGISRLFEAGYQITEVQVVSGHRSWKSLKRYTHIRATSLHRDPASQNTPVNIV